MKKYIRKYISMCLQVSAITAIVGIFVFLRYGDINTNQGIVCFNDFIVYCDYYGFEGVMLFPLLLLSMYYLNSDKRITVLVRYGNVKKYWLNIIKKVGEISLYISLTVTAVFSLMTYIFIVVIKKVSIPCNWSEYTSRYAYSSGKVLDRNPAALEVIIYIFIAVFSIIFIMQLIINYTEWITGNKFKAFLTGVVIVVVEKYIRITHILFERITLMPGVYMRKYGVTVFRCAIYPLILAVIVSVITLLLIKKTDVLKENV